MEICPKCGGKAPVKQTIPVRPDLFQGLDISYLNVGIQRERVCANCGYRYRTIEIPIDREDMGKVIEDTKLYCAKYYKSLK